MRNKIPPPILTALAVALIAGAYRYFPQWSFDFAYARSVGQGFMLAGIAYLLWAGVLFKLRKTTVNPYKPQKTSLVVADGPYKFSRNPMYLGMLLVIIGAGFVLHNWVAVPIVCVFHAYMTRTQIMPEEAALVEKFGAEYTDYMAKVRRWI